MSQKLPFYMVYQIPLQGDDEAMLRRDYAYMKSVYPDTAKRILPFIEDECDRMEYEGSMMYDEYPDVLQMRLMCKRIYNEAEKSEDNPGSWLMDLIQVMLFQELCHRRSEQRGIRKRIYAGGLEGVNIRKE